MNNKQAWEQCRCVCLVVGVGIAESDNWEKVMACRLKERLMEDDNKIVNFFMALILLIAILAFIGMAVLFVWGIVVMVKNGILPVLMGDGA